MGHTIITIIVNAAVSVVNTLERTVNVQMKVKIRGVNLLAYSNQICSKVFTNIVMEWGWCLYLVVDRRMKG